MKFIKYSLMVLCIALATSYVNAQVITNNDENVTHTQQEGESQEHKHQQEEHDFSSDATHVEKKITMTKQLSLISGTVLRNASIKMIRMITANTSIIESSSTYQSFMYLIK